MGKSLHIKLVVVMLLIIVLLMVVVGAFLVQGVQRFYLDEFYEQMQGVFSGEEFSSEVAARAASEDGAQKLREILVAYSGFLGIDAGDRNYYILDGDTGRLILSSDQDAEQVDMTPNIFTALNGSSGSEGNLYSDYMDIAVPVAGKGGHGYIIYIRDNKQSVSKLSGELITIILEALLIGLLIAVFLCFMLSKTMVVPIQALTRAAERVAGGDFSKKITVEEKDEIGVLADTFNNMADQLENNIEELRRSEELRREFVANVSHELRTPITSIRTYAETLTASEDIPRDMEENFLHVILNESDRMTKIVQDLLELSKFDAGKIKISFKKFNITQSIQDVYDAVLLDAQKSGHEMSLEIENELPEIYGDSSRIEQVIMNIISNSIKYTPEGGKISVSGRAEDDEVFITVRDNGIGIPEEDIPRIFDRFYRVDKARSRETGGTGLGLSIAQEIISRHNGRIEVESKLNEGTAVTIVLPAGEADKRTQ